MSHVYIVTPVFAWIVSQILKVLFHRKISWDLLTRSGGMPSAHSASTASLATVIGLINGFDSAEFALSALFSLIVMYDARGVRHETGKQATYLNIFMSELKNDSDESNKFELLKTEIGHSTLQVLAGLIVGITIAIFMGGLYNGS
ncbi:MAG: divergent PAP2 family protein [Spirochaetia bacterium]